jgi:hypothetical protein
MRPTAGDQGHDEIRSIGDQGIDAPIEQSTSVRLGLHPPNLNGQSGCVRSRDEARRDHSGQPRPFRDLKSAVRNSRDRPPKPRSVQGPAYFFASGAGRHSRLEHPSGAKHAKAERPETHAIDCVGRAQNLDGGASELYTVDLELHDDWHVWIAPENLCQRGHAESCTPKWIAVSAAVEMAGVGAHKVRGRPLGYRTMQVCGPFEGPVVVHDHDAIARELNVELQAVYAERQSIVERGKRVFRSERGTAAVREHKWPPRRQKLESHDATVSLIRIESIHDGLSPDPW